MKTAKLSAVGYQTGSLYGEVSTITAQQKLAPFAKVAII
jgi:hypothetical protein